MPPTPATIREAAEAILAHVSIGHTPYEVFALTLARHVLSPTTLPEEENRPWRVVSWNEAGDIVLERTPIDETPEAQLRDALQLMIDEYDDGTHDSAALATAKAALNITPQDGKGA